MFGKILIANRGEIACRVIRTARRLGIATVAVHSEADTDALHARQADEAIAIGPAPAAESYLVGERIIEAARRAGAAAIHPGYGFLAENAGFAEACAAAGLVFIGPPPAAIRAMGLKDAAKAAMAAAGVPVLPGYHGADQDDAVLRAAAAECGFPVLIKAVAGGGGKGMRQVDEIDAFDAALQACRREAKAAFGDDRVLIESFLTRPRHIEVQVFADADGNAVHLFERDCSIQRRHQKVIEEAPAPNMPAAMRAAMGAAAVRVAEAIGYVGAGTVEFIADVADGLDENRFYFMEMNTRLQVEHPVTEMIVGQDLVEWQLRISAGQPLPLRQDDLAIDGHAIEARLYAENPARNFFPASGRLLRYRPPAANRQVRVDDGIVEGDEISIHYDPMIAKIIVHGRDRAAAIGRMRGALADLQIAGLTTNAGFLRTLFAHPSFAAAELDTGFIDRHRDALIPAPAPVPDDVVVLASLDHLLRRAEAARGAAGDPHSPWNRLDAWRLNRPGRDVLHFADGERAIAAMVRFPAAEVFEIGIGDGAVLASVSRAGDGGLRAVIDGHARHCVVAHQGDQRIVLVDGAEYRLRFADPLRLDQVDIEETGRVTAPLPGKILQVMVAAGEQVKKGAPLLVLEAMKMEHTIAAPADGTVGAVHFAAGDQVDEGGELIAFTPADE